MSPHVCGFAAALPPEGAPSFLGAARRKEGNMSPHVCGFAAALPPEGAPSFLGAARRKDA